MEILEDKEIGEGGMVGMMHEVILIQNKKRKSAFRMQSQFL